MSDIEILSKLLQLISFGYSYERSIFELYKQKHIELSDEALNILRGKPVENKKYKVINMLKEAGEPLEKLYSYFEELIRNYESMREVEILLGIYKSRGKILITILSIILAIITAVFPKFLIIISKLFYFIDVNISSIFIIGIISTILCSYYMSVALDLNLVKWVIFSLTIFILIYKLSLQILSKIFVGL